MMILDQLRKAVELLQVTQDFDSKQVLEEESCGNGEQELNCRVISICRIAFVCPGNYAIENCRCDVKG
jgi:hypothetical protein